MMRVGDCLGRRCNSAHLHQKKISMVQKNMSDDDEESFIKRCLEVGISFVHSMEYMCRYRSDFWNHLSSLFLRGVNLGSTGQLVDKRRVRG